MEVPAYGRACCMYLFRNTHHHHKESVCEAHVFNSSTLEEAQESQLGVRSEFQDSQDKGRPCIELEREQWKGYVGGLGGRVSSQKY